MSLTPETLDCIEIPRFRVGDDPDEVKRLVRKAEPFVLEEADNPVFQEFAARAGLERFRELFGEREWVVQCVPRGFFDPDVPFSEQTERMPFTRFLDKIQDPDEDRQHYLNIWPAEGLEFALPFFRELREFGERIPLTRHDQQRLKVFWLGGTGTVTPLHHDTYARSHGVVVGTKEFVMFPPDLRHFRALDPYPLLSTVGWYSRIAAGPLDPERFPALRRTRPHRTVCGPGDFLYLPPCWWHHVSIPQGPTISVSATYYPRSSYLYWYHWRMRLSRWLGGQDGLLTRRRKRATPTATATPGGA